MSIKFKEQYAGIMPGSVGEVIEIKNKTFDDGKLVDALVIIKMTATNSIINLRLEDFKQKVKQEN